MQKATILKILEKIGLSSNESKVYLANLSLGPTTVIKISEYIKVRRTTVYSVLESLKKKGLVSVQHIGLKQKFVAEAPSSLKTLLDQQQNELDRIMPDLTTRFNAGGDESVIKKYEGLKSVKKIYERLLKETRKDDFYYVVSDSSNFFDADPEYFKKFIDRRAKLGADLKLILREGDEASFYKKHERNIDAHIKFIPKERSLSANFTVTPNLLLLHQTSDPIWGLVIENNSLINLQKEVFLSLWEALD